MTGKAHIVGTIWSRIQKHAGNTFYTKTGIEFTYHIRNNYFVLENTNHTITRKQAEEALSIKSDKVSDYSKYQGYAYLWGLLHDSRICGQ